MLAQIRSFALITLSSAALATPMLRADARPMETTLVGPPWISIEYPVNPHDRTTRNAFLLVRCFHHSDPVPCALTGTAEGIVNGERRSIKLTFTETGKTGAYALARQWEDKGVWTLVIRGSATAVVELGPDGLEGTGLADLREDEKQNDAAEPAADDVEEREAEILELTAFPFSSHGQSAEGLT